MYATAQALAQRFDPRITTVEQSTETEARERHFAALYAAHSDYDDVITKIPNWIKTQPQYLQSVLNTVYESGSTQEVLDLVADCKKSLAIAPTPAPAPAPAPVPPVDDLAPVNTKRVAAVPRGTPDPNDFEGAFAEAAAVAQKT